MICIKTFHFFGEDDTDILTPVLRNLVTNT